jgi:hypothetical protein
MGEQWHTLAVAHHTRLVNPCGNEEGGVLDVAKWTPYLHYSSKNSLGNCSLKNSGKLNTLGRKALQRTVSLWKCMQSNTIFSKKQKNVAIYVDNWT